MQDAHIHTHTNTHTHRHSRGAEDTAGLAAWGSQQKVSRDKAVWLWLHVRENLHTTTVQRALRLAHILHSTTHKHTTTNFYICRLHHLQQCTKTVNLDNMCTVCMTWVSGVLQNLLSLFHACRSAPIWAPRHTKLTSKSWWWQRLNDQTVCIASCLTLVLHLDRQQRAQLAGSWSLTCMCVLQFNKKK